MRLATPEVIQPLNIYIEDDDLYGVKVINEQKTTEEA